MNAGVPPSVSVRVVLVQVRWRLSPCAVTQSFSERVGAGGGQLDEDALQRVALLGGHEGVQHVAPDQIAGGESAEHADGTVHPANPEIGVEHEDNGADVVDDRVGEIPALLQLQLGLMLGGDINQGGHEPVDPAVGIDERHDTVVDPARCTVPTDESMPLRVGLAKFEGVADHTGNPGQIIEVGRFEPCARTFALGVSSQQPVGILVGVNQPTGRVAEHHTNRRQVQQDAKAFFAGT